MDMQKWNEAMQYWHSLPQEKFYKLREAAVNQMIESGCEEIGTSDVNHEVFHLIISGRHLEILEELEVTPIHLLTEKEFNELPEDIRHKYPSIKRSWNPSHSNYWFLEISRYVMNGGKLNKKVWDSLHPQAQTYLKHVVPNPCEVGA